MTRGPSRSTSALACVSLVLGGAGNVGAFAVQLAHRTGAFVLASASRRDTDYVMALGANQVIDVREQSFDEYRHSFDVVIDLIGGDALNRSFDAVKPRGQVVSVAAEPNAERAAAAQIRAKFMLVSVTTSTLLALSELFETGALRTRVGEIFPLSQARVAHEMLEGRKHAPGKIVLVP